MTKLVSTLLGAAVWGVPALSFADVGAEMGAEAEGSTDVGAQMQAEGTEDDPDYEADAEGETAAAEAGAGASAGTGVFASANGQTGAGLTLSPEQKGRAYGEVGFHTQDGLTLFSPIIGGGYKVVDNIEVELILPMSFASYDAVDTTGEPVSSSKFVFGDPYIGANYIGAPKEKLRYKVGAGLALPLAPELTEVGHFLALFSAAGIRGYQEYQLWLPSTLSIVTPTRIEYGDELVLGADVQLGLHIPTDGNGRDTELTLGLTPGVGYWLSQQTLVAGRFPFFWAMTDNDAQLAFEPYFRHYFSSVFINGRFTLNIDEPAGFSFDTGKLWGLHVGAGATF